MDNNILVEHHILRTAERLLEHGRAVGPFMPWHRSRNPYIWIVAESLLRRTTRTAACRAFEELVATYPTWRALSSASQQEIAVRISCAGLANQRSQHLKAMARVVVQGFVALDLCERNSFLRLPGVGDYIADTVMVHVCGKEAFPIDRNIQRIVGRVIGLPMPRHNRYPNPYRDPWVRRAVHHLTLQHSATELADIHRGALHVAWESCRPRPTCRLCPIIDVCEFAVEKPSIVNAR